GKQQALRQQLPDQPGPSRAESAANSEFTPALGATRQKKIGHVDARNQEQQRDRTQDGEKSRLDAARQIFLQRADGHALRSSTSALESLGVCPRQRRQNHIELVA